MSVTFELIVPNDDDGHSLGAVVADALPRKGDVFNIIHPSLQNERQREQGDPFIATVDLVVFSVSKDADEQAKADIQVYVIEEHAAPTIYCVCTDEERDLQLAESREDEEKTGDCFNCGKKRP